jgi:hypothetical protein
VERYGIKDARLWFMVDGYRLPPACRAAPARGIVPAASALVTAAADNGRQEKAAPLALPRRGTV